MLAVVNVLGIVVATGDEDFCKAWKAYESDAHQEHMTIMEVAPETVPGDAI